MNNILFIYNIILTIALTIGLAGFHMIYVKNRKKEFLYLSLLYLLLILDNSIVYISEFSDDFYLLYESSQFLYSFIDIIYFGMVVIIRLIIAEHFNDHITKFEKIACIGIPSILVILSLLTPSTVSENAVYVTLFTMFSYLCIRVHRNIINNSSEISMSSSKKHLMVTIVIIILSISGIIESIYYYKESSKTPVDSLIAFEYRLISFDVLRLLICTIGILYLYKSFEKLFHKRSIEDDLDTFCIKYALTSRQKEIIQLIINGYSNKEIGEQLHITEGTVKTHVYNIFKKTDVSNRNQILHKITHE